MNASSIRRSRRQLGFSGSNSGTSTSDIPVFGITVHPWGTPFPGWMFFARALPFPLPYLGHYPYQVLLQSRTTQSHPSTSLRNATGTEPAGSAASANSSSRPLRTIEHFTDGLPDTTMARAAFRRCACARRRSTPTDHGCAAAASGSSGHLGTIAGLHHGVPVASRGWPRSASHSRRR